MSATEKHSTVAEKALRLKQVFVKLYMKIFSGMLRCQYITLFRHSDMGIYFCDVNRTVSQHFLNVADIHIRLQKACSKGVTEHMWCYVKIYGGERGIFVNHSAH